MCISIAFLKSRPLVMSAREFAVVCGRNPVPAAIAAVTLPLLRLQVPERLLGRCDLRTRASAVLMRAVRQASLVCAHKVECRCGCCSTDRLVSIRFKTGTRRTMTRDMLKS